MCSTFGTMSEMLLLYFLVVVLAWRSGYDARKTKCSSAHWWNQCNGKRRSLPHFLMWQPLRAAVHLLSLAPPFQACKHHINSIHAIHHLVLSWDILHHLDFVLNIHLSKARQFWMTLSGASHYWLFVCDRCLLPAAAGSRRSLVSGPSHAEAPRWP